ncbi:cupin domain-containing protein [Vibrio sp. CAIM 722]|uniref:Cupin domain-containing protein n=1 Tax=Vibrio eleionomae TaxID=2653505 RepID=A0A7X4LKM7_9VIBR|nr:cupin domain-containing protein [Vibrio eleionomae]MZI93331.1 cupin domain-containing protein [Vibrio eleionomae]
MQRRIKGWLLTSVAMLFSITATQALAAEQSLYTAENQGEFEGPAEYFSGKVHVKMAFPANEIAHYSGAFVTFDKGARTAWHSHPAGQHMIVTQGTALTVTRDDKVVKFRSGEAVWCPPGIDHWHGATPDASMTHFVVTASDEKGQNVVWKEKVSDKEYRAAAQTKIH